MTWYRGGWCPYCNIALRGFHKSLPEIRAAGATLVAISPETPDNTLSTAEKNHLDFEVLSDHGNKVAHAYGVAYKIPRVIAEQFKGRLDLARHNGDESGTLPLGATYVIDREGTIRYAFVDADYRKRAEPSHVLAAVRPGQESLSLLPIPGPVLACRAGQDSAVSAIPGVASLAGTKTRARPSRNRPPERRRGPINHRAEGDLSVRHRIELLALLAPLLVAGPRRDRAMPADEGNEPKRMVLVELYTSQGCDMCPTAENVLGALAERDPRIVPIAFHVDYFNDPWKDVFSEPLYSQRQMAYNQLYTKAKNPEYGLYYTPMMMIDGEQSVNGRDPAAARAAIRQALARKPAVALDVRPRARAGRALRHGRRQGDEPVAPGREDAALGLRRAPRGRRRHRHPGGRERGQVAGRALPGSEDEI